MTPLDGELSTSVSEALNQRAGGHVDAETLLRGAQDRGRTMILRRRAWQATGIAALAATVVLAGVWPTGGPSGGLPDQIVGQSSETPSPSLGPLPLPPLAPGVQPDPQTIGQGQYFHMSLAPEALAGPADRIYWDSSNGLERLNLMVDRVQTDLRLTRNAADLPDQEGTRTTTAIDGQTAYVAVVPFTQPSHPTDPSRWRNPPSAGPYVTIRWRPAPGVWAQVSGVGRDAMIRVAQSVRFDQLRRCATSFRLTSVPAGTTLAGCHFSATAPADPQVTARITLRVEDWYLLVEVQPPGPIDANTTVGGRDAWVSEYPGDGGRKIMQARVDYGTHIGDFLAEGKYEKATALAIIAGYQPAAWPANPMP